MSSAMMTFKAKKKSAALAYVLWFFLGWLSMHRFYAGKTISALIQLLLGVGALVMLIVSFGVSFSAALNQDGAGVGAGAGIMILSGLVWVTVAIWLIIDLFLINRWITRHNVRLAEDLGAAAP